MMTKDHHILPRSHLVVVGSNYGEKGERVC